MKHTLKLDTLAVQTFPTEVAPRARAEAPSYIDYTMCQTCYSCPFTG